jgi:hypothetical protein
MKAPLSRNRVRRGPITDEIVPIFERQSISIHFHGVLKSSEWHRRMIVRGLKKVNDSEPYRLTNLTPIG